MPKHIAALVLVACLFSAIDSQLQADHLIDFDTTFPSFGYAYDYSGYGDAAFSNIDSSDQVTASYDVNTPPAATASFDTSMWNIPPDSTYTYAGFGLGIGLVMPEEQRPASGMLSDYTVSFDASVAGYSELFDGLRTDVQVLIQIPDDDDPDTNAEQISIGANAGNLGNLPELPLLSTTPQTFTINFGDLAVFDDTAFDFSTRFNEVFIFILQLQPSTNAAEIGIDNDNILTVDNVEFQGPFGGGGGLGGDFDNDNDVDGEDFLIWQRGESPGGLTADDLDQIRMNFGQAAPIAAIPEPSGVLLLATAVALTAGRLRRHG
jgi:hypothetical protein